MLFPKDIRKIQVKDGDDGTWVDVNMGQLEEGDVFRMFNPDGSQVIDHDGRTEWVVEMNPSIPIVTGK